VAFTSTFRYIDNVLSINDNQFHSYVDSIYPNELEIKDTTECSTSASYWNVLLKMDTHGKMTTQLYDKQNDFNFSIGNLPYLCSYIPASSVYGVYISQLARHTVMFYFEAVYWVLTNKLTSQEFQLSANFMVVTTILLAHTTFFGPYNDLGRLSQVIWPLNRGCLLLHGNWSHLWYIQRSVYPYSLVYISYRT
jgi:hypothetical protein